MTPEALGQALAAVPVAGLLAFAILAIYKRWIVLGADHRERMAERDEEVEYWRDIAMRGLKVGEKVADVAERKTRA